MLSRIRTSHYILNQENLSDKELWNLIRINDREAFETIYHRYWEGLMVSAFSVLEDKEVCQDILQDVFADLWIKRRTTFIDNIPAYLKVTVRNNVFKHMRSGYISQKHLDSLEKISFVDATEEAVNFNQLKEQYEKSVEELPERCREVFRLSRVENLTVKEIAAKLNISPKTVENQITKALSHLRNTLGTSLLAFVIHFLL